jgi:hypothetical protein
MLISAFGPIVAIPEKRWMGNFFLSPGLLVDGAGCGVELDQRSADGTG